MQELLPTTAAYDISFLFVNITVCFHIPFGSHVVWGPKTKQTTSNILDHISLTLKIFSSCRSKLRQQNFRSKSLSKILPNPSSQNYIRIRLGHCWLQANSWALEDDMEIFLVQIEALRIECMAAQTRNCKIPNLDQTNLSSSKGDVKTILTDDNPNKLTTTNTSTRPSTLTHAHADNNIAHFCLLFAPYNHKNNNISAQQ